MRAEKIKQGCRDIQHPAKKNSKPISSLAIIDIAGLGKVEISIDVFFLVKAEAQDSSDYDLYLYWFVSGYLDEVECKSVSNCGIPAYERGREIAYQEGEILTHISESMGDSNDY